jgi:3-deoxy-D-manno-octulosonate 8-phosphate phosphatase (KDO 8-P phosphatase)
VKLVLLDVDGVQTDGGLYIGAGPDGAKIELKRFEIQDGLGVRMLVAAGLDVVLLSGRASLANRHRAEDLGVAWYEAPGGNKLVVAQRIVDERAADWSAVACLCDDLADLPILMRAGLPAAVANAVPEVRAAAHWITRARGGNGAVREFAEALLRARGEWPGHVDAYVHARSH